jgi:class 3 adenylate cyclase
MLCALYLDLPIVVLVLPGLAMRHVEAFRQETGAVDVTHAKPYVPQELRMLVGRLVRTRVLARDSVERTQTLQRLLPADALAAALDAQRVRLIDATVLFSDIRRSTELAARLSPCEMFDVIGGSLAAQGAAVQASHGSVVKYTGDGLLAIFTGSGRSYLALRAARELQALDAGGAGPHGLRIGVGIAAGPIFSGLIGDPNHPRYDVLGASIHLAARLCAAAGPGEVVATRRVVAAARVPIPCNAVDLAIEARGFPEPVPSWRFTAPTDATHLAIVPDASSPSPSLHRA